MVDWTPGWVVPKTVEILSIVSLHDTEYLELDLGGLHHPMIPWHGTTAAHHSLRGWVKCGGDILHPSGCDN